MQFGVLGPLQVMTGDPDEPRVTPAARPRALLAALLLRANQPVPVDELAELVWDGAPPSGTREATRALVMRLRRQLDERAAARIVTRPPGYVIEISCDELDASRFEMLTQEAGAAVRADRWAHAARAAAQALGLWRGTPLTDIPSQLLRDQWVPHLEQVLVQALEWHIEAGLREGRHEALIPELRDLTARYPLRERFHGQLMQALYRCGRQAEALAAYQQARDVLVAELGVEPGQALHALHQQMLTGDPALSPPRDPGPAVTAGPAPAAATASAVDVRFSLPPDSAAFTGREAQLERITATVLDGARAGGVVAIHAIGGMPGVGKTALAVHAAHLLRKEFPGRCLFIDLHAHTPGHDPMPPETALAELLAAAGVEARNLPSDLDGRAALWRDTMAGQRALLVLDNAASSRQVAPLLPGGDGCLVLVTSRRQLADLPGAPAPLLLETLPPGQAREMFARLAPRAATGPGETVAELMGLAGYLPLAISLLARLFARHPSWTLADLVTETRQSLLRLAAENDTVAAAFELSYQDLDPAQQRFFTLLGLQPGTTTDPYAAAALTGTALPQATRTLDGLHAEGLLTETGYRRYGMHDLLRRYARDHATALPPQTSERAVGRLLDYYQHTATLAQDLLARQTRPEPPPATPPPRAAPVLQEAGRALAWARAERDSLLACLDHMTHTGQHARVIALTTDLAELLRRDGPWAEAITRHRAALHSARHLSDRPGQAGALTSVGSLRRLTGDHLGAVRDLEQALAIYRDLGNPLGQANTLECLGETRYLSDDYRGAARDLEQALVIYRDLGDPLGQAKTLNGLGSVRALTCDYRGSVGYLEQALAIYRDLGDRLGHANALTSLGNLRRLTGDYQGAAGDLEQALAIFRDLGDRLGQGGALTHLGTVRQETGDYLGAAQVLEQALAIFRDLGDRIGQGGALLYLGTARRLTGDYQGAAGDLAQALAVFRDIGNRGGEVEALNETATLHRLRGETAEALARHQQALDMARAIGSAMDEARALAGLGRCALAVADPATAQASLSQAAEIFQRIGAPEATLVATELAALTKPGS
jgi:DNA-binding SARP family transcriptional activator/tetratricopeptide (TPR) repeat protein